MAITKRQVADLAKQTFEYAPAPEAIDHVRIQPRYGLFIGGKMLEPHRKKRFSTINPATEQKLSEVAEADAVDVGKAVKAAGTAFTSWSRMAPSRRARYLFRISRLIQERARELGDLSENAEYHAAREIQGQVQATSFITPAGPTSWSGRSPTGNRVRWAWPAR